MTMSSNSMGIVIMTNWCGGCDRCNYHGRFIDLSVCVRCGRVNSDDGVDGFASVVFNTADHGVISIQSLQDYYFDTMPVHNEKHYRSSVVCLLRTAYKLNNRSKFGWCCNRIFQERSAICWNMVVCLHHFFVMQCRTIDDDYIVRYWFRRKGVSKS